MIEISRDIKKKAVAALIEVRGNHSGSNEKFAKQWGFSGAVWSRMRSGTIDGLINDSIWLHICRELNVVAGERKWKAARTDVFITIEEDVLFCKEHAKAKMFVDECAIGKTFAVKYLSKKLQNCFYVDASQAKTQQLLVRKLAKAIGLDSTGRYNAIKDEIKAYLKMLPEPIVIIDEAGDLNYNALLELKEFWNATEGACGWYLVGADGLSEKLRRGMNARKVGFREIFSRFSSSFTRCVPNGEQDKKAFYRKLYSDVLEVNMEDKAQMETVIRRCISTDMSENEGGLRRVESLLILNNKR
ncbi:ATP-binding protein [Mucilaginibacter sp.]|uniref:ATP-binding protein n=1 Tax=Mucilaginibacter sp. TaxID=1882438 RepID=UPI002620C93D|nr:ATP-binding protein [Mucilaginibacter sp.]MDB5029715.1 hypothetical protein [Mucilaginibacter sp.]